MKEQIKDKIIFLETENIKLKDEIKRLTTWVKILTKNKEKLQQKIQVLETSIRNFQITIGYDKE